MGDFSLLMQLGGLFIFFSVCIHPAGGGGLSLREETKGRQRKCQGVGRGLLQREAQAARFLTIWEATQRGREEEQAGQQVCGGGVRGCHWLLALAGVLMGLLGDGRAAEPTSLSSGPRFHASSFQTVPACLALG